MTITTHNEVHFRHEKTPSGVLFLSTGRHYGSYKRLVTERTIAEARRALLQEFPNAKF